MEQKNNYQKLYLVSIVAIIAIVAVVAMVILVKPNAVVEKNQPTLKIPVIAEDTQEDNLVGNARESPICVRNGYPCDSVPPWPCCSDSCWNNICGAAPAGTRN